MGDILPIVSVVASLLASIGVIYAIRVNSSKLNADRKEEIENAALLRKQVEDHTEQLKALQQKIDHLEAEKHSAQIEKTELAAQMDQIVKFMGRLEKAVDDLTNKMDSHIQKEHSRDS